MLIIILNNLTSASSLSAATGPAVLSGSTLNAPVEDIVVLVTLTDKEVTEELAEVRVIRLVVETEGASVVEED